MTPRDLDRLFPVDRQREYISILQRRGGLTRRRAECLVRLWGYLLLKENHPDGAQPRTPLQELSIQSGFISCTHREAAELFYDNQDRGSDRAAGLMVDRLAALGLLDKEFDGQTLCLKIRALPELLSNLPEEKPPELIFDAFDPRADAVPVAKLMTKAYFELVRDSAATTYKISKSLRAWAANYVQCMRVVRRADTRNPVGIMILYPTTSESEVNFFHPPSRSFFLTNDRAADPFLMAKPGDPHCSSLYVRAWLIDSPHLNGESLCQFIYDTQATLRQIKQDFPAICDMYSMIIHPSHEKLRRIMGFERVSQDSQRSYYWAYLAIDRYLKLIPEKVVTDLDSGVNI